MIDSLEIAATKFGETSFVNSQFTRYFMGVCYNKINGVHSSSLKSPRPTSENIQNEFGQVMKMVCNLERAGEIRLDSKKIAKLMRVTDAVAKEQISRSAIDGDLDLLWKDGKVSILRYSNVIFWQAPQRVRPDSGGGFSHPTTHVVEAIHA